MKVALVIGHKLFSGGAVSYNGISEFEYNEELVGMVANNLVDSNVEPLIFHRKLYRDLPKELNTKNPDLIISFHRNAFNTKATGSEVLYYYKSNTGRHTAATLLNAIHECSGLVNHGVKAKSAEDRGGYLLRYTHAPCVILEPFFIDNPLDFSIGVDFKEDLALAISDAIIKLAK